MQSVIMMLDQLKKSRIKFIEKIRNGKENQRREVADVVKFEKKNSL